MGQWQCNVAVDGVDTLHSRVDDSSQEHGVSLETIKRPLLYALNMHRTPYSVPTWTFVDKLNSLIHIILLFFVLHTEYGALHRAPPRRSSSRLSPI